jgi:hypothetical protein
MRDRRTAAGAGAPRIPNGRAMPADIAACRRMPHLHSLGRVLRAASPSTPASRFRPRIDIGIDIDPMSRRQQRRDTRVARSITGRCRR